MAPKRKQTDDSAPVASSSTRSTRASSKTSAAKNTAKESASSNTKKSSAKSATPSVTTENGTESNKPSKRARTNASTRKGTAASRKAQFVDEPSPLGKVSSIKEIPFGRVDIDTTDPAPPTPAKPTATPKRPTNQEVYSPQRALELFSKYADSDDVNVIGPEGFERICTDADMPLDGPRPIIFAWQMGAQDMAKISKDEWIKGTGTLKISSVSQISIAIAELDELLMQGKTPVAAGSKNQDYDRTSYFSYSTNVKAAFQKLYLFSFTLVKPEQSKNIDMETSVAFWTVLLVPKYPIMEDVVKFINEKGTYKATNKDLWSMILEFCETVSPSLEDYEADGAWPTLLDDFVIWKKASSGQGSNMDN